jgi:hypothetical protein
MGRRDDERGLVLFRLMERSEEGGAWPSFVCPCTRKIRGDCCNL